MSKGIKSFLPLFLWIQGSLLCSNKHSSRFYKLCSSAHCGLEGRIKPLECGTDRQNIRACVGQYKQKLCVRAPRPAPKSPGQHGQRGARSPSPQHRQPGAAQLGQGSGHRQLPVYLEGKGSRCRNISSSLTPAKQFPSPQVAPNLSIWAGAGAKYLAGRQDPVSVWLVRGVRSKASSVIWFFSAWRQQNEMGFPDLSGHSHLLTLADGS